MIIQDNALKAYLKNVYFITGTPCGGKTTISRALAQRHGLTDCSTAVSYTHLDVDKRQTRNSSCRIG